MKKSNSGIFTASVCGGCLAMLSQGESLDAVKHHVTLLRQGFLTLILTR